MLCGGNHQTDDGTFAVTIPMWFNHWENVGPVERSSMSARQRLPCHYYPIWKEKARQGEFHFLSLECRKHTPPRIWKPLPNCFHKPFPTELDGLPLLQNWKGRRREKGCFVGWPLKWYGKLWAFGWIRTVSGYSSYIVRGSWCNVVGITRGPQGKVCQWWWI